MKNKAGPIAGALWLGLSLMAVVGMFACDEAPTPNPQQVAISSKVGDSCVVDHKCKIIVRRWERPRGEAEDKTGGNVYYRCLVPDSFYNQVNMEERVLMDTSSKDCEKMMP